MLWLPLLLLFGLGGHFAAPHQVVAVRPGAVVQAGHAPGSYQHQALGHEHAAVGNEALAAGGKEPRSEGGSWGLPPVMAAELLAQAVFRSHSGPQGCLSIGAPVLRTRLQASIIPNAP